MPRENRSPVSQQEAKAFDAFALAEGAVPEPAYTPADEKPAVEGQTPAQPEPAPTRAKAKSKADPEKPAVRRMGRRRTGRNVPFSQMVTAETANNFYDTQQKLDITMGEVLERAINALIEKMKREGEGG